MRILISFIFIILSSVLINAQNLLIQPESVAFDSVHNRYLVSNYGNGRIISITPSGDQSIFAQGFGHCYGNCILGNTLYVSCGSVLRGIDLDDTTVVFEETVTTIINLDGMAADSSGHLYVVDTGGKILKYYLQEGYFTEFVSSGLRQYTQDIIFDHFNNRLLAVSWTTQAPIQAIDLADSTISTVVTTSYGYYDGITIDQYGNVYLASHYSSGYIITYTPAFTNPPTIISAGLNEPAGLDYNQGDNMLAVPNFGGNSVDIFPVFPVGIKNKPLVGQPREFILNSCYPNPFNAQINIDFYTESDNTITFRIFDIQGRFIETIEKQRFNPGYNQIVFNAGELSSGVYFLRAETAGKVSTQKIIYQK